MGKRFLRGLVLTVAASASTMAHSTLKAPTTSTLPWEKSLQIIATSLTGPVAQSLGLIGLFVAGGMLIFGGELADWARRVCWVILAFCVMVMASDFITVVFPSVIPV